MRAGCESLQDFLAVLLNNLTAAVTDTSDETERKFLPDLSCQYPIRGSLSGKGESGR